MATTPSKQTNDVAAGTSTLAAGIEPASAELWAQYGCGPVQFSGTSDALYERHLLFDSVRDPAAAGP
jgi:starch phosphorylase